MNIAALKDVKKGLDEKTGSKGFLNTKDLTPDGVLFRLLPPPAIMNGIPHLPVFEWWFPVNGKQTRVIDVCTFKDVDGHNKPSVIEAEIEEAYGFEDADVNEVLEALNPNTRRKILTKQESAWMAGLQLEYQYGKDGDEVTGVTVVDGVAKVFQCGKPTLLSDIIGIITSPQAARRCKGLEDGIADRVKGSNFLLCKEGKGLLTKYKAVLDDEFEMDSKWFRNVPNVYETAKAQCANASWQRAAIRNYLYGEAIPADVQAKEDARIEKAKAAYTAAQQANAAEAPAAKPKKKAVAEDEDEAPAAKAPKKKAVADEDEDDAPAPKKSAAKKPVADIDEDDEPAPVKKAKKPVAEPEPEEDEDDVPPAKKAPTKKPASIDLEDEDDDAPAPVIKKKSPPPPPAKKAAPVKRTVLDDLDLDED